MSLIAQDQQRRVEENLLRFTLADTVLIRALAAVARIPLKSLRPIEVDHRMYMTEVYRWCKRSGSAGQRVARVTPPRILLP